MTYVPSVHSSHAQKISADALFTLFGVYGDVQRVKILYNKRHTALVQMTNHQQAQLGTGLRPQAKGFYDISKPFLWPWRVRSSHVAHPPWLVGCTLGWPVVRMLNNVPLYGSPMSLVISSHMVVKLPRPGTEEVPIRPVPSRPVPFAAHSLTTPSLLRARP